MSGTLLALELRKREMEEVLGLAIPRNLDDLMLPVFRFGSLNWLMGGKLRADPSRLVLDASLKPRWNFSRVSWSGKSG